LAWRVTHRRILDLELQEAQNHVAENIAAARALFDARFPGPWHLEPAPAGQPPLDIYNGNGRLAAYRVTVPMTGYL
jgi:hypothetical protein